MKTTDTTDLLETLQKFITQIDNERGVDQLQLHEAREAIAKANLLWRQFTKRRWGNRERV